MHFEFVSQFREQQFSFPFEYHLQEFKKIFRKVYLHSLWYKSKRIFKIRDILLYMVYTLQYTKERKSKLHDIEDLGVGEDTETIQRFGFNSMDVTRK